MAAASPEIVHALPCAPAAAVAASPDAVSPEQPASAPPPAPTRRIPPPCWTHDEVMILIDAYRDKWVALRRGNLRAPHWQEVADVIARRIPSSSPKPKTAVQCRHKIEKLRKRYRAEKRRLLSAGPLSSSRAPSPSSWLYFRKFDAMEPEAPASTSAATPLVTIARPPPPSSSSGSSSDDEGNEDGEKAGNTRSLHRLMSNGVGVRFRLPKPNNSPIPPAYPNPNSVKSRPLSSEKRRRRDDPVGDVAAAIRQLADEFMRVEKMKMDVAKETERMRMEMETKRMKMILESQEQIIDSFTRSLASKSKPKRLSSTEN